MGVPLVSLIFEICSRNMVPSQVFTSPYTPHQDVISGVGVNVYVGDSFAGTPCLFSKE